MITQSQVEQQLKRLHCNYAFWGSTEVAELPKLLMDGEQIAAAVNGYYEGGFGLLVATNFRVLVIDKKPFTLNVEDLRYDMITEVTFGARIITATMHVSIPTRTIYFVSWNIDRLHKAMRHIQQHVMDARNGGSPLPDDWFARQLQVKGTNSSKVNHVIALARFALRAHDEITLPVPQFGHRSAEHAVNPYARIAAAARRRRFPAPSP